MVSTNDKKIYEMSRIFRSHGMLREVNNKKYQNQIINKYKDLHKNFIFLYPTLNFRNNEIGAVIGLNQLKILDKNNRLRIRNFKLFLSLVDEKHFFTEFDLKGSCNYAFPVILKTKSFKKRDYFEKMMKRFNIEFRRGNAGGGNQLRQPYLKNILGNLNLKNFQNVDHVHFFGYYIGNYPSLKQNKIKKICNILNGILDKS